MLIRNGLTSLFPERFPVNFNYITGTSTDISELFNEVATGTVVPVEVTSAPEPLAASKWDLQEKAVRPTMVFGGKVIDSGARVWRVPAGKERPTKDIFAIFDGKDIKELIIRDPYALATDRAISAQIAFLSGLANMLDALDDAGISIEHAPVKDGPYKGVVERLHRTVKTRCLDKLPGAVPFKPQKNKDLEIDPVSDARLTLGKCSIGQIQSKILSN